MLPNIGRLNEEKKIMCKEHQCYFWLRVYETAFYIPISFKPTKSGTLCCNYNIQIPTINYGTYLRKVERMSTGMYPTCTLNDISKSCSKENRQRGGMKGTGIQSWIKNAGCEKAGTLVLFRQAATGHAHADRVTALLNALYLDAPGPDVGVGICKNTCCCRRRRSHCHSRPLSDLNQGSAV